MLCENGVKFVDQALCKFPRFPNAVDHKLNGGLLVPEEIDEKGRFDVCVGARYEFFSEAVRNECFRGPAIEIVEAF